MTTKSDFRRRLGLGALLAAGLAFSVRAQQPPAFKSEVNVVPLDLIVLNQDGRPVPGLEAADFQVTVDGEPRKVLSAQYLSSASSTQPAQPTLSQAKAWNADDAFDAVYVTNERTGGEGATPARRVVIAIDQRSFGMAAGHNAAVAARGLLELLHPTDLVGLSVFPPPGPNIAPTRDRQRLREALAQVTGASEPYPRTEIPMTVSEALTWASGSSSQGELLSVGCHAENAAECRAQLDEASRVIVDYARRATRMSLQGLTGVIERIGADDTPTTVVLVSAGVYGGGATSRLGVEDDLRQISRLAAESRARLYAFFVESEFLDQGSLDRPSTGLSRADAELRLSGLQTIAGASGGSVVRVSSGRTDSFRRVALELSAYYLIGLESRPGDRDGKRHRIRVRASRPNLTVRSREDLYLPAERKFFGDEAVRQALLAPRLERALPVRLSVQCMREAENETKVRVVISAQIDRGVKGAGRIRVGYSIRAAGAAGAVGTSEVVNHALEVIGSGEDATLAYMDAVSLTPGRYLVRLAATDGSGRVGSAQQVVDALLIGGEGVAFSDLLLRDPARVLKDAIAPVADGRVTGDGLEAFVEVYPHPGQQVSSVAFEVSDTPGGPAIAGGTVKPDRKAADRLTAGVNLDVRALPIGTYMLNARLLDGDRLLGRTTRPFRVDRPLGGGPRAGFGFAASGGVVRRFAREDVLQPDALQFFLGRLRTVDPAAKGEALASAADALGSSRFDAVAPALTGQPDGLSVAFLRGLALFGQGQLEPAAAAFRAALHLSNDFLPAAFYLGACYAAGGRDREAAGAWQTSLISEAEARIVYEVLTDAWLRLEDAKRAGSVIAEAQSRWPDDDRFAPRLAAVRVLMEKRNEAFAAIEPYVQRHPSEVEPLFLAIRLLYEAFDAGKPIRSAAEDRVLAEKYGAMYRQAAGPNVLLVNRWVGAITKKK